MLPVSALAKNGGNGGGKPGDGDGEPGIAINPVPGVIAPPVTYTTTELHWSGDLNEWKKAGREKRGGGAEVLSLDYGDADRIGAFEAIDGESPDRLFDRQWGYHLLQRTLDRLGSSYETEGKGETFEVLKDVLGQRGAAVHHRELGEKLGIGEGAVKVAVHRLRKRYRRFLKEEIAHTLDDPSEAVVDDEIRFLFGVFSG